MTQFEEFKKNLIEMHDKFEPILKGDTEKFIQIAANYVEQNPKLLEANRPTLYSEIMRAAQNGLYIDGQESALAPFKGNVKWMSMYKGLLKQVRNSGELDSINCGVVYEKDVFESFTDENGEHLRHVPDFKAGKERGKPVATYCIARIKGGKSPYIEIMTEEEIQNCRKSSRSGDNSPWDGLFADEMRKKTILRRISKRLPNSTDLNAAIHADDDLFIPPVDEPTEKPSAPETSSRLRDAVAPAPAASPAPEKKLSETAEGVIDETNVFKVSKDGKPAELYSCKVAGVQYLTFNADIYKAMTTAKDKKAKVMVIFQKATSASNKPYNETLDIKEISVPEEEVPI